MIIVPITWKLCSPMINICHCIADPDLQEGGADKFLTKFLPFFKFFFRKLKKLSYPQKFLMTFFSHSPLFFTFYPPRHKWGPNSVYKTTFYTKFSSSLNSFTFFTPIYFFTINIFFSRGGPNSVAKTDRGYGRISPH